LVLVYQPKKRGETETKKKQMFSPCGLLRPIVGQIPAIIADAGQTINNTHSSFFFFFTL
jgi:hypothetical protein